MSADPLEYTLKSTHKPLERVWEFGFNTCHAPIAMRSDVQHQMRLAHEQLGHRFWRCHGTLSDDVGIVTSDPITKETVYCFSGLARILDAGLAAGVKPFFELSFTPGKLTASKSPTITHYRGITTPPDSDEAWGKLIRALMEFLLARYGREEVAMWYFEFWNEPNIAFWNSDQARYFQLYRVTALAIKESGDEFRIGGPATARAEWVDEFLGFCGETQTPVDYLSTHIYPSDVAFVDSAEGDVQLLGLDFLQRHFSKVRQQADRFRPGLPVFWGEWNSSAGPLAANHDECNNGALVAGALASMARHSQGSLFWNLSDIYEECSYHFLPFHGGYGLYTVDHLPKACARAMEFFHRLPEREVTLQPAGTPPASAGAIAAESADGSVGIVMWNHAEPGRDSGAIQFHFDLGDRAFSFRKLQRVLPGKGSAYETWLKMERPANPTPEQWEQLRAASQPEATEVSAGDGSVVVEIPAGSLGYLDMGSSQRLG